MRVRILRDFATANRSYVAGQVEDIDPRKAESWLRAGLVMQDKSLDGASETKTIPFPKLPPDSEPRIEMAKPKPKRKSKNKIGR